MPNFMSVFIEFLDTVIEDYKSKLSTIYPLTHFVHDLKLQGWINKANSVQWILLRYSMREKLILSGSNCGLAGPTAQIQSWPCDICMVFTPCLCDYMGFLGVLVSSRISWMCWKVNRLLEMFLYVCVWQNSHPVLHFVCPAVFTPLSIAQTSTLLRDFCPHKHLCLSTTIPPQGSSRCQLCTWFGARDLMSLFQRKAHHS